MSSIIKVNTYQDANGNALFSSDGSGNVTTSASGLQNTPAFFAYLSADQSITANTATKANINTEVIDTNNDYDNSTNYRYTPSVAGKYFVFGQLGLASNAASTYKEGWIQIRKNGTAIITSVMDMRNGFGFESFVSASMVVDMNGSTDYLEIYGLMDDTGGTTRFYVRGQNNHFGAYRIIGA